MQIQTQTETSSLPLKTEKTIGTILSQTKPEKILSDRFVIATVRAIDRIFKVYTTCSKRLVKLRLNLLQTQQQQKKNFACKRRETVQISIEKTSLASSAARYGPSTSSTVLNRIRSHQSRRWSLQVSTNKKKQVRCR